MTRFCSGSNPDMEMHNANELGNGQPYMIPESSHLIVNPQFEQVENMYPEGAPEFVVDQGGVYYPTATNYGFYCTGFGAPSDWEDHHRIFGVDGPDVQFMGVQSENLPYVYYSPSYGYAEAQYNPYNPYNPYIPGAMIGVDNPFVGPQQYYAVPPYQNSVSSSGYIPIIVQSDPPEALLNTGTSNIRPEGRGSKSNYTSQSAAFPRNSSKASNHAHMNRISDGAKDTGLGKPYGGAVTTSTSRAFQGRSASSSVQHVNSNFSGKVPSHRNQFKVGYPELGSSGHGWVSAEKIRPKFHLGGLQDNVNVPNDSFGEQNPGLRTNRPKSQLAVKAYTTKAGNANAQGIIVIDTDQYNKDDFPLDYEDGKFFVIKSYSEDDVHKSVKYNVWSSTPHGNKKLQSAYEEAQKSAAGKPRGCPIFLFFSVNASGQFCGVAEMIGPVDFHKDMDFWQQDKWSGSFPVKWHFIKDVQNTAFRHIILENNENKPVTNSRDTQEIFYKQGMDILKIFKNHTLKTSILDDFMYYEDRQKIMQEDRARLMTRSFHSPFSVPAVDPPRKMLNFINGPSFQGAIGNLRDPNSVKKDSTTGNEPVDPRAKEKSPGRTSPEEGKDGMTSVLKIGTLTINPRTEDGSDKAPSLAFATNVDMEQFDVVTVGSVPVKVNGFNEASGSLTVGTIPRDPRAHHSDREGAASRGGVPRN